MELLVPAARVQRSVRVHRVTGPEDAVQRAVDGRRARNVRQLRQLAHHLAPLRAREDLAHLFHPLRVVFDVAQRSHEGLVVRLQLLDLAVQLGVEVGAELADLQQQDAVHDEVLQLALRQRDAGGAGGAART